MNDVMIIIVGMTGNLAKRKLIPALYHLVATRTLEHFVIIGAALEHIDIKQILERARSYIPCVDAQAWNQFARRCYYQQIDATNESDFVSLLQRIDELEHEFELNGNRLLYCATASDYFCPITVNSIKAGIISKKEKADCPWMRVIYEKPFGTDLQSAHTINDCIASLLHDDQIYRIDHYLTEEIVSNIALVRFTNCVFEPLWNNRFIDQVQIILDEELCLDGRGNYYDTYGALKDVVQNHMLELLALIAMEAPDRLPGEHIRVERARVLKQVEVVDVLLGQYEGYRQENGVPAQSQTETFAIIYLEINNPRWAGVPFYLRTGKCLQKKRTAVHIKFKQVDCLLAKKCPSDPNFLSIEIAPNPSFSLTLNVKKPGFSHEVVPVNMEFCHSCLFKDNKVESYEVLFEEVIRGEHSVSVRFDEIEYTWKVIDAIKEMELPIYRYEQKSEGPKEVEQFAQKHGMRWRV